MARKRRTEREADEEDAVLRGPTFAEKQYAAAEREQARENERMALPTPDEAAAFVSPAEIEEFEGDLAPVEEEEEP
jgi:hypothetical protein